MREYLIYSENIFITVLYITKIYLAHLLDFPAENGIFTSLILSRFSRNFELTYSVRTYLFTRFLNKNLLNLLDSMIELLRLKQKRVTLMGFETILALLYLFFNTREPPLTSLLIKGAIIQGEGSIAKRSPGPVEQWKVFYSATSYMH